MKLFAALAAAALLTAGGISLSTFGVRLATGDSQSVIQIQSNDWLQQGLQP